MKRYKVGMLVACVVASTVTGCVKKESVLSAAAVAGVGAAIAVLGDQFKAKKRLGVDSSHVFGMRFRKKKAQLEDVVASTEEVSDAVVDVVDNVRAEMELPGAPFEGR